jgi:hypothetical protein
LSRRIRETIQRRAGQAEQCEPKERRHDRVGEVFGERFQRRFPHLTGTELGGVAAHDVREPAAARVERLFQRAFDRLHLADQHAERKQRFQQQRRHDNADH